MLIEFTEKACQVLFVLFWTLIVCTELLRSYNFSSFFCWKALKH